MKKLGKEIIALLSLLVAVLAMSTGVFAAETLVAPSLYYGNEAAATMTYSYTKNDTVDSGEAGIVIPVKVNEAGTIKFDFEFQQLQKDMFIYVYTDAACTNRIGYIDSADVGDVSNSDYVAVTNAGTYYLKLYSYVYSSTGDFTNTVKVSASVYTRADKTIKSGQTITYYRNKSDDVYWFKYKAEKTGMLSISVTRQYGSYIHIANAKKKIITDEIWVSEAIGNYTANIAVKKGKTYYIQVTAIGSDCPNTISVKNSAVKEKSGAKKKKAVAIKAKKKVKGTIIVGDKTADWYKFTVKKKKAVTMNLSGDVQGSLTITVYKKNGKKIDSCKWYGGATKLKLTCSRTRGKVDKGTYYIKISRSNAKSSGKYTLKWK